MNANRRTKRNWRKTAGTFLVTLAAVAAVLSAGAVSRGVELFRARDFQPVPVPASPTGFPSDANTAQLKVTIHEWDVPTKGAHPHDPAVGADGAL